MDPELSDADMEALNKLADDVEKLNKQMQRFEESRRLQAESRANKFDCMLDVLEQMVRRSQPEPLFEDQSIQLENSSQVSIPAVAACGLDDPCDVEVKPIGSETSSQHLGVKYSSKPNNLIKSETTVDASCEVQKCDLVVDEYPKEDHDSLEVSTIADQSVVVDSVQTQVTFNHLSSEVSLDFVWNKSEVVEWKETLGFAKSICVSNCNLSICSHGVCQNASMDYSSYFMMRTNSDSYILVPEMKAEDLSVLLRNMNDFNEVESSLLCRLQLRKGIKSVQWCPYVKLVDGNFVYDKGKEHKYKKKNDLKIYEQLVQDIGLMDWFSYFAMHTNVICNQSYILSQKKKVRFDKPPAKPPDDVVICADAEAYSETIWNKQGSHRVWLQSEVVKWEYANCGVIFPFLLPPAKPPDSISIGVSTIERSYFEVAADYKYTGQENFNSKNVIGLMSVLKGDKAAAADLAFSVDSLYIFSTYMISEMGSWCFIVSLGIHALSTRPPAKPPHDSSKGRDGDELMPHTDSSNSAPNSQDRHLIHPAPYDAYVVDNMRSLAVHFDISQTRFMPSENCWADFYLYTCQSASVENTHNHKLLIEGILAGMGALRSYKLMRWWILFSWKEFADTYFVLGFADFMVAHHDFLWLSSPRPPEIVTLRTRSILRGEECYVLNIIEIKGCICN